MRLQAAARVVVSGNGRNHIGMLHVAAPGIDILSGKERGSRGDLELDNREIETDLQML